MGSDLRVVVGAFPVAEPGVVEPAELDRLVGAGRITSYNVCYTKLLRAIEADRHVDNRLDGLHHPRKDLRPVLLARTEIDVERLRAGLHLGDRELLEEARILRITSYNVCYTKLLRLLFAGFSFCQSIACLVDLLWAWGRGVAGADSAYLVGLLAATESTSIVFLWLAFFPPRFYRRWIDSLAELDGAAEGHG